MIKANELRIGNKILFNNFIEPQKIVTIDARFFSSLAGGRNGIELKPDEEISNYYAPIPLTHDVLLKCGLRIDRIDTTEYKGFEMTTITTYYTDWDWIEESGGFEMRITTNSKDGTIAINHKYKSNVKYLHELQNLYFALTNQELNIQL